jgi:hypothetical protein
MPFSMSNEFGLTCAETRGKALRYSATVAKQPFQRLNRSIFRGKVRKTDTEDRDPRAIRAPETPAEYAE